MSTVNWSLQHKRDTAANFTSNNPTLLAGQLGIETDGLLTTPKFKIGNGTTAWTGLPYASGGGGSQTLAQTLALGATTGGNNITLTNGDKILSATAGSSLDFGSGLYAQLQSGTGATCATLLLQDGAGFLLSANNGADGWGYGVGGLYGTSSGDINLTGTDVIISTKLTTPLIAGSGATTTGLTFSTSVTASGAIARGVYQTPTLIAAANGDALYGLYLTPTFTLGAFTSTNSFGLGMTCGTAQIKIGNLTGSTSIAAIYMNTATPTASNYTIYNSSTQLRLNMDSTTGALNFQLGGSAALTLRGASTGASPQFDFTPVNRTNQTTGTNNPNFKFTGASTSKTSGADPLQYFTWFTSNTLAYTAGSTCTLAASAAFEYITAGANVTAITTSAALYVPTKSLTATTTGVGLLIEAPTGATNNLAAKFTGGSVVMSGAALATTATSGYVYLTTCAGVPTGVPDVMTGTAAVQIDSTNNKMYIYSGGAWVALN